MLKGTSIIMYWENELTPLLEQNSNAILPLENNLNNSSDAIIYFLNRESVDFLLWLSPVTEHNA